MVTLTRSECVTITPNPARMPGILRHVQLKLRLVQLQLRLEQLKLRPVQLKFRLVQFI